jgi:peptidoglycan/LPS O-acetylase OafA/YrhL
MLNKNYRNDGIDLFRGLSIIFVILLHINIRIPFNESPLGQILPESINKIFFKSGYYGVIIFFVISGFLITSTSIPIAIENTKLRALN